MQKTFDNLSLSMGWQDEKGLGEVEKSQTDAFKGSFILLTAEPHQGLIDQFILWTLGGRIVREKLMFFYDEKAIQ